MNIPKLRNESRARRPEMFDDLIRMAEEKWLCERHCTGFALNNKRQVEKVARRRLISSMEHFFCDDLCRCFNAHAFAEQVPAFKCVFFG